MSNIRVWTYMGVFIHDNGEKTVILDGPVLNDRKFDLVEKRHYDQAVKERDELLKYKEDMASLYREVDLDRNNTKSEINSLKAALREVTICASRDQARDMAERALGEKLSR